MRKSILGFRFKLIVYRLVWIIGLPLAFLYIQWRGLRDRRYRAHFDERLGLGSGISVDIWVHAASLGEIRAAVPLVREFLEVDQKIVLTCLTPAGRQEAENAFVVERQCKSIIIRYMPVEIRSIQIRFLHKFQPGMCLIVEHDLWPMMIMTAKHQGLPAVLCNSLYPGRSYARDRRRDALRMGVLKHLHAAVVKSDIHAERFLSCGVPVVKVGGELRFDQPVPRRQIEAADRLATLLGLGGAGRPVLTLASVVGEEDQFLANAVDEIKARFAATEQQKPLIVYVPRAREHFRKTAELLRQFGNSVMIRSEVLSEELEPKIDLDWDCMDILLGDSLGEMFFYLQLADLVVVGGGFAPEGSHNFIEPMALGKPVIVGPNDWTIEFPIVEAMEAGAAIKLESNEELAGTVYSVLTDEIRRTMLGEASRRFHEKHRGASLRHFALLQKFVEVRSE